MTEIAIPYGAYWSTPFAKWQGSLSRLHSLRFTAYAARHALARRGIDPAVFDYGALGLTVPQPNCFYGLPWLMAELGAPQVAGPTISQACATSARIVASVADEIRAGAASVGLADVLDEVHEATDGGGSGGDGRGSIVDEMLIISDSRGEGQEALAVKVGRLRRARHGDERGRHIYH